MVSGVPKPQVLAICSIGPVRGLEQSAGRLEPDGLDVVCGGDADLGLEDAGELAFGEVDLPGEGGHGEVVGEVVPQPGQQVAYRLGVGGLAGQQCGELGLAAGTLEVDDQSPGNRGGGTVPVVVGDERQREVDPSGDSGGGPHVAVADVDGVGVHGDTLVAVLEEPACVPVGGRPTTLQQAGGGEDEGA